MIYKVLSLLMVILVVLTGCAINPPVSQPPAVEQKESRPPAEKPKAEQPKPAPEQPKPAAGPAKPSAKPAAPSGTLNTALSSFGEDTLDPMLGGTSNYQALIYPMFEQIVGDDGKGKLDPVIAESWSFTPNGKVWTFKIRKGIKFHNGDELTSADVKFSVERLTSEKSRASVVSVLRPVIDRMDTPDPYTLVITTKDATAVLPELFTGGTVVMPKKYVEEKGEDFFGRNPVGTGPWKFVKHEAGASLELEAVKDHWRITPAFQKLVEKLVPEETTRVAMLKRGEADVVEISVDRVDEVKAAGLEVRTLNDVSGPIMYLPGTYLDTGMPTQNIKFRQALALAIDRDEIANQFFKGFAKPASRVKIAPYSWGYDPSWKPEPYDPQKARTLLAEAGYPGKFKDPVINLWSYQVPGANWLPQLMQIVSGYWEAIGVKTKITPIDFGAMRALYRARPVDPKIVGTVFSFNERAQPFPLMSIVNAYGSKGILSLLQDPAWDDLYLKVLGEIDENKRKELSRQLMNLGYSHYASIVSVNVEQLYASSNKVGEWQALVPYIGQAYEGIQHK